MISRAVFPVFSTPAMELSEPPPAPDATARVVRERARLEGLEAGRREGRAHAHAEWTSRLAELAAALEGAAGDLQRHRAELAATLDEALPRVVLLLAQKVLDRELTDQDGARAAIRRMSERLLGDGEPIVRLSPRAAELFETWRGAQRDVRGRVEIDPALGPGEWVVDARDVAFDGRLESQLAEAWRLLVEPS